MIKKRKLILFLVFWIVPTLPAVASDASNKVLEGIRHFEKKDMEAAARAFAEADVAMPENLRIAFNQACVYAAMADIDKSIELFQKASLSRDKDLALWSRYNLGSVATAQATATFGEHPEEATPEIREEGLSHLTRAARHYMDCLKLDENHEDARYNLELIRLWIKHMEAVWKERDKQKQRDEMDLLQFLQTFCVITLLRKINYGFSPYTLLCFLGLQPLWGMGVASLMLCISSPLFAKVFKAESLPPPTPLINTSISLAETGNSGKR